MTEHTGQWPQHEDELDREPQAPARVPFWTVAVYLCDRAYGGPEEGGWWYDVGSRQDDLVDEFGKVVPRIFDNEDEAYAYAVQLQDRLDDGGINDDGRNRDLSSVCCEGRYVAEVHNGYPPPGYPDQRPHYE